MNPRSKFIKLQLLIQYGSRSPGLPASPGGPGEKSYLIRMKFRTRKFSRLLITNPRSKFMNSKWRIQYRY